MNTRFFEEERREMIAAIRAMADHVAAQIGKTALDERVLMAMAKVPRHEFVPIEVQQYAYLNRPIPIGFDKAISQPVMVAVMTDLLELKPDDMVLEIGTGLGYQAAVLAELAGKVYSVEIIDELAQRAIRRLKQQGHTSVEVRIGNGYAGWPEHAPFDKVIVAAAGPRPPEGDHPHRYLFTVFAVKTDKLDVKADTSAAVVGFNLHFNTLAKAAIMRLFKR
jgi:protein-L-isoaspartate(D-aspartate) O-methyltransferase